MTLNDISSRFGAGESAQDLIRAILAGIVRSETSPDRLSAFISYDYERALTAAAAIDAATAAGSTPPLAGVPVAVKDNICTVDYATTCASRILANFRAPYDATVVARLRAGGAIIVGKTNLDEFAMGSTTETSAFGRVRNPYDLSRITGGSSGGSAAAVAAGLVPIALGSDTAGSVRQPAALCGVTGFKPTYGRISRYGLVAHVSSLDTVGIIAQRVRDVATVYEVIAGADEHDATSRPAPVAAPRYDGLAGRVVGVPLEYFPDELHTGVRASCERALDAMRAAGAVVRAVELPHTRYAIPAYYAIGTAEASSNLARYDGVRYGMRERGGSGIQALYEQTRAIGFGREVKRRILLGLYVLGELDRVTLRRARRAQQLIEQDFARLFASGIELVFTPTTGAPAARAGELRDPYELYLSDLFTVAANLAGLPAISLPIGKADDLPVGGQFMAPRWADAALFSAGAALQELLA